MTQLAGHAGGFIEALPGFMLKKLNEKECRCLGLLMEDELKPFVPEFRGVVDKNGNKYVEMKDLLVDFESPAIMDVKIGTRTYVADNDNDDDDDSVDDDDDHDDEIPRPDLYQKMIRIDPKAPSEKEKSEGSITKLRYMDYRDSISSTKSLGFRIEAVKSLDGDATKDFKTLKDFDAVKEQFRRFCGVEGGGGEGKGGGGNGNTEDSPTTQQRQLAASFLQRLDKLRSTLESSTFFRSHQVVGSSLLFAHDAQGHLGVWMIDFCNTDPLSKGVAISHLEPFVAQQHHEDGYLIGVDNIVRIFRAIADVE